MLLKTYIPAHKIKNTNTENSIDKTNTTTNTTTTINKSKRLTLRVSGISGCQWYKWLNSAWMRLWYWKRVPWVNSGSKVNLRLYWLRCCT